MEEKEGRRRGRRPVGERPKTAAERVAESRARKAAAAAAAAASLSGLVVRLRELAILSGGDVGAELAQIAAQLEGMPAPVHLAAASQIAAAGERRTQLLERFADLLNQAHDDQVLDRIERRIAILADISG